MNYRKFSSIFANKYGQDNFSRFIWGHGGEPGAEWVDFKDVLFEARPSYEKRLSPFDVSSWDLLNRREYRALLLAWVGVGGELHGARQQEKCRMMSTNESMCGS